jgi:hypothetical protein
MLPGATTAHEQAVMFLPGTWLLLYFFLRLSLLSLAMAATRPCLAHGHFFAGLCQRGKEAATSQ